MMSPAPLVAQQAEITPLSTADATKAAEQLLNALQQRQGSALHARLSAAVRDSLSREQVQERLDQRPAIKSSRVVGIASGYRTTTVDAVVQTAKGDENLLFVLDDEGLLLAWKWVDEVLPIERTALDFAGDLAAGRWPTARSKLSLEF